MDIGFAEINSVVDGLLTLGIILSVFIAPAATAGLIKVKATKDSLLKVIDQSILENKSFLRVARETGEKKAEKELKKIL